jgi:hypothetical protein
MLFSGVAGAANQLLCDELANDPLGRGYAAMDEQATAADINSAYRTQWKTCVAGSDLLDAIEAADWVAITDAKQQQTLSLLAIGCLNPQRNARTMMIGIFGAGSSTIANMAAAQESISRAQELGLSRVRAGDVQSCR